jgi:hypothetical protein
MLGIWLRQYVRSLALWDRVRLQAIVADRTGGKGMWSGRALCSPRLMRVGAASCPKHRRQPADGIRRSVFRSIVDRQAAINAYLTEHNANPRPFVWTKCADAIRAKLGRLPVSSESA